jgi:hypothetical protein
MRLPVELPPIPFIVGMTRSGTTLLREMFSAHPDIYIPDESQFLLKICKHPDRYESADGLDWESLVRDLCRIPKFKWWGASCEEVREVLRRESPRSFSDALRELFRYVAQSEGKSRYGDKTPQIVTMLPTFAKLLPEARFIHLIRDGRDVALSHLSLKSGIDRIEEVAIVWRSQVEKGRDYGKELTPARYREVLYEDLVKDPERVLRSLCDFVALEFDRGMLRYYEKPSKALDSEPQHVSVSMPPKERIRDWRHQMSKDQIEIFEGLAGDLLESLGYERVFPTVSTKMRRRARLARAYVHGKGTAKKMLRLMKS